jgi:hypothetical protein
MRVFHLALILDLFEFASCSNFLINTVFFIDRSLFCMWRFVRQFIYYSKSEIDFTIGCRQIETMQDSLKKARLKLVAQHRWRATVWITPSVCLLHIRK